MESNDDDRTEWDQRDEIAVKSMVGISCWRKYKQRALGKPV